MNQRGLEYNKIKHGNKTHRLQHKIRRKKLRDSVSIEGDYSRRLAIKVASRTTSSHGHNVGNGGWRWGLRRLLPKCWPCERTEAAVGIALACASVLPV
jgi:hypothetical protein